jgi:hypothetical protein
MMKKSIVIALISSMAWLGQGARADVNETFTTADQNPWDGTADLTWLGDVGTMQVYSNILSQISLTDVDPHVILTAMGTTGYDDGRSWSGMLGSAGDPMAVNANHWGGLLLASDSTNVVDILAGSMNGFRLIWKTGDFLALEEAAGAGWIEREAVIIGAQNFEVDPTFTATLSSAGIFTFADDQGNAGSYNAGGPVTSGQYAGYIFQCATTTRSFEMDDFSVVAEAGEPAPNAVDDIYQFFPETMPVLSVAAPGILENDTYGGALALSALLVADNTTNGVLNLSTNGAFTYTPDTNFFGTETFAYKAVTSATTSEVATVTITSFKRQAVLHYTFDTDLTDSSGNGNDGSYFDTNVVDSISTSSRFGGGSLSLTGPAGSNYVELASSISFATENEWGISLWYNASATNTAGLAGDNLQNNTLTYNPSGGANRSYYLRGGSSFDFNTWTNSNPIDTGTWHHLVITASGSGNVVKAYEDGVEMFPEWDVADETWMAFNRIGHDGNTAGFGGFFDGLIDEVWIMNYALSSTEVASLYNNNTLGGSVLTPAEIVSFVPDASDTMKMVIQLDGGANPSQYSPKYKSDLHSGTWDPVPHADSPAGTFAVSNLSYAASEGTEAAIYVKSTNTVEFFRIDGQ